MAGAVAVQQAMVKELGLSYRAVERLTGTSHRSVWQHVNRAYQGGANVTPWESRSRVERGEAVDKARDILFRQSPSP